jgi:Ca2+-binding RTX toxin-like protein
MEDSARGGDDVLIGGDGAESNYLVGDAAQVMQNSARGGDDLLIGGDYAENAFYGDATDMTGDARAGRDILIGGNHASNLIRGDGQEVSTTVDLADDRIIGGRHSTNDLAGDGNLLSLASGGDDLIRGGAHSENTLQGDARYLFSQGGNDTLIASHTGSNELYGDAYQMLNPAFGGDDRLISGRGDDHLWGDAKFRSGIYLGEATEDEWLEDPPVTDDTTGGADTFVFKLGNGDDTIHDFEQGKDIIELCLIGKLDAFDDLSIAQDGDDSVIDLGCGDSITVIGVDELGESDFDFGPAEWSDLLIG